MSSFGTFKDEADYRRFHATRIGRLAARFHPDASLRVLQLVSNWYGWMFLRDDQRDESELGERPEQLAASNARFLEILEGSKPVSEEVPLAHSLWDLRRRVLTEAPAREWMEQLIASIGEHFDSTVWEATNRSRGVIPDMDNYIRMRPVTGGLNVDTQFIEIAEHTHLSPEVRNHPILQTLTRTSNNAVCWANDIFSLHKEIERDVHNLVLVLQRAEGLTLQQAIDRAAEMHNAEVRTFIDSAAQLRSLGEQPDENLERFVGVLQTRMRGFVDWANESGRYQPSVGVSQSEPGDRT
ncbi:MAG TPA: hypothetical protein VFJ72_00300 [Rubrobacteraceae bacterium]|nr:hypothetical protein [Rubrobacteraceae bacterium]